MVFIYFIDFPKMLSFKSGAFAEEGKQRGVRTYFDGVSALRTTPGGAIFHMLFHLILIQRYKVYPHIREES